MEFTKIQSKYKIYLSKYRLRGKLKQQVGAVAAIPIVHENATWIQTVKAKILRSVKKFIR
jgi:hypothetical protein